MEKRLEEMKMLLRDLMFEVADLKERVLALEKSIKTDEAFSRSMPREVSETRGPENLADIYREGYHVCPMAYGRLREGDCLFCVNFLEKGYGYGNKG